MTNGFAKRMTELRRKKGITQKQAAASLGISQALLSHYEKGVRECGLDFLLKAAAFYEVTVDYLLSKEKKEKPLTPAQETQRLFNGGNKVIFDMVEKTRDPQLLSQATDFMALAYYRLYRLLYWGGHPNRSPFTLPEQTYRALADAGMEISEVKLQCVLEGMDIGQYKGVDVHELEVDQEELTRRYGKEYLDILAIIEKAENRLAKP